MIKKVLILSILASSLFSQFCQAQNNASPYSIIGIGDIEKSSFDRTTGMGYAGMALSSNRFINNSNPASYSFLDDKFFNIELAARFKNVNYSGTPITSLSDQSSDAQFKKIVVAMKLKPRWGAALGILPFSNTNYSFYGNKSVIGTNYTVPAYYDGSGSISQFFFANSYKLNNNFSIGLHAAYLFGQQNQNETVVSGVSDSILNTSRKVSISSGYFKTGFQYNHKLSKTVQVFVGGTASFKTQISGKYHLLVTDGNTSLVDNTNYKTQVFTLPAQYTGSIATKLRDKFTIAVDYSFQNYSNLNYKGLGYSIVNSNRISSGIEFSKKQTFRNLSFEKHFFQAGFFYSNSYLQINNQPINDYGFTVGGGFNALRSNLGVQLQLEVGKLGTTSYNLIQQNYVQATLILSYRDFWFVRVKQYD